MSDAGVVRPLLINQGAANGSVVNTTSARQTTTSQLRIKRLGGRHDDAVEALVRTCVPPSLAAACRRCCLAMPVRLQVQGADEERRRNGPA